MLTEEALEATLEVAFERRDDAIRKEFKNVYDRFDRTDAALEREFKNVYDRFDHIDGRFASVEGRIDVIEKRLEKVDERLEKVDERLEKVDERLMQFFQLSMAQSTNPRAASSRDKILPMGIISPSSPLQLLFPPARYFPNTVIEFWNLQNPKRVHKLVHLCHFYSIRSEEIIGDYSTETMPQDMSDSDQEGEASSIPIPEDAESILHTTVINNPLKALSCLASRLFLEYETISYNMATINEIRERRAEREAKGIKREAVGEEDSGNSGRLPEPNKRLATDKTSREERTNREDLPAAKLPILVGGRPAELLEDIPRDPSSPSPQSHVKWASRSDSTGERRRIEDGSLYRLSSAQAVAVPEASSESKVDRPSKKGGKKETKSPSRTSKGSTIPFSQTPVAFKEAAERRRQKDGSTTSK